MCATKAPCLRITDADASVQWLSESRAIVEYLRERFAGWQA